MGIVDFLLDYFDFDRNILRLKFCLFSKGIIPSIVEILYRRIFASIR